MISPNGVFERAWTALGHELRPMLALAGPVVLAELGWMTMSIVDTLMVGPLGPEAIGAVGIGSNLFFALVIFGLGVLLGLDTLVSQAFGGGRRDECRQWLLHGVYASLILTVPLTALAVAVTTWWLPAWGVHPDVLPRAVGYLRILNGSVLPLLLYACFRRYLQAIGRVRPVMFALVSANVVNIVVNWVLIFGHFGAPALGVRGAAWATCLSRVYMAGVLFAAIALHEAGDWRGEVIVRLKPELERLRRLVALGTPAALQITLEFGVFAAATLLAGMLDPPSLAAHHIALTVIGFLFMVPLGISSAGAVRVGHAIGRDDAIGAGRSGWTALALGITFMLATAISFVLVPDLFVRMFTTDRAVIAQGIALLGVAAVFQLFDGTQVVATGVLRGLGDTRTPMLSNFAGHWIVGLPLGYALCFAFGWGVVGLWVGLSTGLIFVGIVLLGTWARRAHALEETLKRPAA